MPVFVCEGAAGCVINHFSAEGRFAETEARLCTKMMRHFIDFHYLGWKGSGTQDRGKLLACGPMLCGIHVKLCKVLAVVCLSHLKSFKYNLWILSIVSC